ncbi:MAG: hypothetical protein ACI9ON_003680 [Limisphaerales bacterium]|jgi:hypothetical protein
MRVLFLTTPIDPPHNDNHLRIPQAFRQAGWVVDETPHESLRLENGILVAGVFELLSYDLIWPVGLGPARSFLDRAQLMSLVPTQQIVSPTDRQTFLHNKALWLEHAPLSFVSANLKEAEAFVSEQQGLWVLKPTAASFGNDVVKIEHAEELAPYFGEGRYWLLQRYIDGISQGELRTLVAGNQILGSYLRQPPDGKFIANLSQGGVAAPGILSPIQTQKIEFVKAQLANSGIRFAAIDMCEEWVLDVNIANPGGLASLSQVYDRDYGPDLVAAIGTGL